jgi:riboflavin kinase/FMN adenylyltransferase
MTVVRTPSDLESVPRAVAIGTFDGVHRGHRAAIQAAKAAGLRSTVVTFDPHPRLVLGYDVQLLTTLPRRIELLQEAGPDDILVLEFTEALSALEPEEFVARVLEPIGTRAEGVSSSRIRELLAAGRMGEAATLLGRPHELEGTVVSGDQRGGALGFPTANLAVEPHLLVPAYGIYAGAALGGRAAISIGINPHYGGSERRIEAFLLDFGGDLYGKELRIELWERLRDERAFESEDVEATRGAVRPG